MKENKKILIQSQFTIKIMKKLVTVAQKMDELTEVKGIIQELKNQLSTLADEKNSQIRRNLTKELKKTRRKRDKLKVELLPAIQEFKVIEEIANYVIKHLKAVSQTNDEIRQTHILERIYVNLKEQFKAYNLVMRFLNIKRDCWRYDEQEEDLLHEFDEVFIILHLTGMALKVARQEKNMFSSETLNIYSTELIEAQERLLAVASDIIKLQPISDPYYVVDMLTFLPEDINDSIPLKSLEKRIIILRHLQEGWQTTGNDPLLQTEFVKTKKELFNVFKSHSINDAQYLLETLTEKLIRIYTDWIDTISTFKKACQKIRRAIEKKHEAKKKKQQGPGFIDHLLAGAATANMSTHISTLRDYNPEDYTSTSLHKNRVELISQEAEEARREAFKYLNAWTANLLKLNHELESLGISLKDIDDYIPDSAENTPTNDEIFQIKFLMK